MEIPKAFKHFLIHSPVLKFIMGLFVFTVSIFLLSFPEHTGLEGFEDPVPGQTAPQTVHAKCEFLTQDFDKTRQAQDEAAGAVPRYYKRMDDATQRIRRRFTDFFAELRKREAAEKAKKVYTQTGGGTDGAFLTVQELSQEDFLFLCRIGQNEAAAKEFMTKIENQILNKGVLTGKEKNGPPSSLICVFDKVDGKIRDFYSEPLSRILSEQEAGDIAATLLIEQFRSRDPEERSAFQRRLTRIFSVFFSGGNLAADHARTEKEEELCREKVLPLHRNIRIGDTLIEKHRKLTAEDIALLKDYQKELQAMRVSSNSRQTLIRKILLCLLFLTFTVVSSFRLQPSFIKDNRVIWLLGIIAILSILMNRVFGGLFQALCEQKDIPPQLIFMALPLALPSILVSVICGLRATVYITIFTTGAAAIMLGDSFPVLVTGLFCGGVAGTAVRRVSDYKKFFLASCLSITFCLVISGLVFQMPFLDFSRWNQYGEALRDLLVLSVWTGFLTAVLSLIALFLLESVFDVSTNMSFLSFTDRNHPLLRRLQLEAPGTYHHSERVASIAEKAAVRIGANPLQVQACALFHDIGKLSAPDMFTENSFTENPMEGKTPLEAASIIRKHVTFGLELARKFNLKKPIRDAILQHHGTDFISYFYEMAQKSSLFKPDEEDFRYPGPEPDSRETALLTLADCAEAIARSLKNPTEEELRKKLTDLILRKLENGQFRNAPVTIGELYLLRDSFVESLLAMGHTRIAYPNLNGEKK